MHSDLTPPRQGLASAVDHRERAARIIEAACDRGSDARDLRDAAHEATHAMEWGSESWDREGIHAYCPDDRSEAIASEILARAVERIVCRDLGQPIENPEHWILVAYMETIKTVGVCPPLATFAAAVDRAEASAAARAMADRVIALGDA